MTAPAYIPCECPMHRNQPCPDSATHLVRRDSKLMGESFVRKLCPDCKIAYEGLDGVSIILLPAMLEPGIQFGPAKDEVPTRELIKVEVDADHEAEIGEQIAVIEKLELRLEDTKSNVIHALETALDELQQAVSTDDKLIVNLANAFIIEGHDDSNPDAFASLLQFRDLVRQLHHEQWNLTNLVCNRR